MWIATFGAAVAACEPPTDPIAQPQPRLVIHAVLDAAASRHSVRVQEIDGSFGHRLVDLGGALVTITTPSGEVIVADQVSGLPGEPEIGYSAFIVPLVPGGTYTLNVTTPIGQEASGTTTVPMFQHYGGPESVPFFRRATDTLRLLWRSVPLARRYEVTVESTFRTGVNTFFVQTYRTFADTSITIAGSARTADNDPVFVPGSGQVLVTAVDDNYYTYYHLNVDPFAGAPPSRLTGALGVFGSVAPILSRVLEDIR